MVATVCLEQGISLYEPRKKTDPVYNISIPDADVYAIDRERVLNSDLCIHLCHYPSTGSGEELDFAYGALVPIILISHADTKVSRMITGIPALKFLITYKEPEDLRQELRERLIQIRPLLEERKLAFSEYNVNIVGERIRLRREELALTRDDVARSVPLLTVDALRQIEESVDRVSNPALLQLRQIATVLKTTVADLVEPDLGARLIGVLEGWVSGKVAARSGINLKDRNRILRRVLLRLIDSLEE
jgi:transcriptional regulator with XRE-family HTH domain